MNNFEDVSSTSIPADSTPNLADNLESKLASNPEIEACAKSGFDPEKLVPAPTYVEAGIERLIAMCDALGLEAKTSQAIEIFRGMTTSWGDKQVGDVSGWRSDVSDDGAPFEFSIAFKKDRAELRFLLEAQGQNNDLQSNWQAGLELNQYLAANFGVSLDRFQQIQDLFVPNNPEAKLAMWHAVCIYPDKEPSFKIYLNPHAQGASKAAAVVEESLVRLGFTHAWIGLAETAAQRGPDKDDFIYFSLDLAADDKARVKVYLRHFEATPAELDAALSLADNYVAGDAIEFCQAMAPDRASFSAKPVITAFAWIAEDNVTPSCGTLHLPISNYATDDRAVCDSIDLYFIQHGLPFSKYQSAIKAGAKRDLEAGIGLHSYVSLCREQEHQQRFVFYLNPEVNTINYSKTISTVSIVNQALCSLQETVEYCKSNSIEYHPLFQRMHRENISLEKLWLLFANFQEGIVSNFTRRLSIVTSRLENNDIRFLLEKQLNEELGNGDSTKNHKLIFDNFINGLEEYKPDNITKDMLKPAYELSEKLEQIYCHSNPYIGVGAAIIMEVRGEQRDIIVNKELARSTLDTEIIFWFQLHERLEGNHADELIALSKYIDKLNVEKESVLQGLKLTSNVLWSFCNQMYRVCYSA